MKVLVVGSGGREHAIAREVKKSPLCDLLLCAPGNPGMAELGECVPVKGEDVEGIVALAKERGIDFVVVGPEGPLVAGLTDRLSEAGIPSYGPSALAARLEGSKAFSKAVMKKYGIPTAAFETFTDLAAALAFVREKGAPIVVKSFNERGFSFNFFFHHNLFLSCFCFFSNSLKFFFSPMRRYGNNRKNRIKSSWKRSKFICVWI